MQNFPKQIVYLRDNFISKEKEVQSALLLVIMKMSRIFGIAPVLLTSEGVYCSRFLICYSRVLIILLNVLILAGFAIDVITEINEPHRSMRLESPVNSTVWAVNIIIVMILVSDGVLNAPRRFLSIFEILQHKNKIISEIRSNRVTYFIRNKSSVLLLSMLTLLPILLIVDFQQFYCTGSDNNKHLIPMYLYGAFYIKYFIVLLLEIQFVFLINIPYNGLRAMNAKLRQLLDDPRGKKKSLSKEDLYTETFFEETRNKSRHLNFLIDSLVVGTEVHFRRVCVKLRALSGSYLEMCTMIRNINNRNGTMLLFMLLLIFLDLVINPYYWIMSLLNIKYHSTDVAMETMWCIFHAFNTVFVLEPCNKTLFEIEQTRTIVSLLINRFSTNREVSVELDKFLIHLELNKPTYSPMGMCTISRSLITAIISAVITCLVIIVQFQSTA